ncbi:MAG: GTP cyclohydrolase I FolE [Anaerolineae bacterium]|jgi:GTP cyclohydrolase I|nr:GTP cyclohydrolase I FolE [Anaerolineae bacterium]
MAQNNLSKNGNGNGNGHGHNNGNGHGHADTTTPESEDIFSSLQEKFTSEDFLRTFELDLPAVDLPAIEDATRSVLTAVGENPDREGLQRTPHRVAKAMAELLQGYRVDPAKLINDALFEVEYDDMVIVRDIPYQSLCEHHMLPFLGKAQIAYIPNGKVIGLSKIPRIVDMFSQRLQVQERMTRQIAEFINEVLQPKGVAVVLDGVHMCSMIRGVKKHGSGMTTSSMLGVFRADERTRGEFMAHIHRASGQSFL